MAESEVTLNPGSGGAEVRTQMVLENGQEVHQQVVTLADADGTLIGPANGLDVADLYSTFDNFGGWQATDGGVLTFTVAGGSPVDMLWVRIDDGSGGNAVATCDPSGGTPTAAAGIPLDDGIDKPITLQTSSVQVYSATSSKYVKVWGFRY